MTTNFQGVGPETDFSLYIRWMRTAYQGGLAQWLRGEQQVPALSLMGRVLDRLERELGELPYSRLWWLAGGLIEALETGGVAPDADTRRLFATLDAGLRDAITQGRVIFDREPDEPLRAAFLDKVLQAPPATPRIRAIHGVFGESDDASVPEGDDGLPDGVDFDIPALPGADGDDATASADIIVGAADDLPPDILHGLDEVTNIFRDIASANQDALTDSSTLTGLGLPDDDVRYEARPPTVDNAIVEMFLNEADEELDAIRDNLRRWPDDPTNADFLHRIREALFTLRNSGRLVHEQGISDLAGAGEALLSSLLLKSGQPDDALLALLNEMTDALFAMVGNVRANERGCLDVRDLVSRVDHLAMA